MKNKKIIIVSALFALMLVFSGLVFADETKVSYDGAMQKTVKYYVENFAEKQIVLDNWQDIMALAEAKVEIWEVPWQLAQWKLGDLSGESDALDYAKLILSMSAAREDPYNFQGRNLVTELTALQGENGGFGLNTRLTYWAMLALDQVQGDYDRSTAISYLISQQNDNGGFSWINRGSPSDVDSTGIALMALANHQEVDGVKESIERAVNYLKAMQKETAGFGTDIDKDENCESTAYGIMGLLACEEDIMAVAWQKNTNTMIDALLSFQLSDGSFSHLTAGSSDPLATRQALNALAQIVRSGIRGGGGSGETGGDEPTKEKTVRVRVEGYKNSLADERVKVEGSALDALKVAVGEDQLVVSDGWICEIKGETPQEAIVEGINTNWMYYVIREGDIEPNAFDSGSDSYKIQDGDEIIFYIGASDGVTWEGKTYFPKVTINNKNATAGEAVTISMDAFKYVYPDGLSALSSEEKDAIGNFTLQYAGETYTSSFGQVIIENVPAGEMEYIISNGSASGYPNVITYKGTLRVLPAKDKTVRVRVEGHKNSLADEKVTVPGTALDALKAALGEPQVEAFGGYISQIGEESGKIGIQEGINTDWMYYVIRNGEIEPSAFDLGSNSYNVQDGDEIIFYIGASDGATWEGKTYFPQVSINPANIKDGNAVTMAIGVKKYNWLSGLTDLGDEEKEAIGEFQVVIGEKTYSSVDGQVIIPNVTQGLIPFQVINGNDGGYPNVVTYKGSFLVQSGGNTGGSSDDIRIRVFVQGEGVAVMFYLGQGLSPYPKRIPMAGQPWGP